MKKILGLSLLTLFLGSTAVEAQTVCINDWRGRRCYDEFPGAPRFRPGVHVENFYGVPPVRRGWVAPGWGGGVAFGFGWGGGFAGVVIPPPVIVMPPPVRVVPPPVYMPPPSGYGHEPRYDHRRPYEPTVPGPPPGYDPRYGDYPPPPAPPK